MCISVLCSEVEFLRSLCTEHNERTPPSMTFNSSEIQQFACGDTDVVSWLMLAISVRDIALMPTLLGSKYTTLQGTGGTITPLVLLVRSAFDLT